MHLLEAFFKNRYLRAYEKAILYAVRDHLPTQDKRLFEKQLLVIDRGMRDDFDTGVQLYSSSYGRRGDWPEELLFKKNNYDGPFAKVSLRNKHKPKRVFDVDVFLDDSRIYSLVFYDTPRNALDREDNSDLEIINVDVLSYLTEDGEKRRYDKCVEMTFSGWLGAMARKGNIVRHSDPIRPEEEKELVAQWGDAIPSGYLEVIIQSNGLVLSKGEIYRAADIWKISIPDGEFLVLGEVFLKGYIGVLNPGKDNILCLYSHEDGVCEVNCGLDKFSDFLTKVTTSLS